MPELPEVETIKRILDPMLKGKKISSIEIFREKTLITDPKEFVSSLLGKRFLSVSRQGKFLIFHVEGQLVIISHLRMEGKYFEGKAGDPFSKHDLLCYNFTDGSRLVYNDVRKFGIIGLYHEDDYMEKSPVKELGKEPFTLSAEELYQGLQKKKTAPIKEALLDQTLISGLGNIYDDEVLYACYINPKTCAKDITLAQAQSIILESQRILNTAIENGGSTIKSYHPKEGVSGNMQNNLLAYGKQGKPCSRCGFPMRKISIGGRGTTYCPICQRNAHAPFVLAVTGPIHSGKSSVAEFYKGKGYIVFDADKIVSDLYQQEAVIATMQEMFSPDVVKDGKIDRSALRNLVEKDALSKEALEGYIHPLVKESMEKAISELEPTDKVLLDVPLLFKEGIDELANAIILVTSPLEKQKERLEKEGRDAGDLLSINKGWPMSKAKEKASFVIVNDGSLDELKKKLSALKGL